MAQGKADLLSTSIRWWELSSNKVKVTASLDTKRGSISLFDVGLTINIDI